MSKAKISFFLIIKISLYEHVINTNRLNVSVKKSNGMNLFDGLENLKTEANGGRHRETLLGRLSPQIGQISPLQSHYQIVELVVSTTPVKLARMLFP